MPITVQTCSYCKELFPASRKDTLYCSEAHKQAAATKRKKGEGLTPDGNPLPHRRDLQPAPDAVWPTDNQLEIPLLDLTMCADRVQVPVAKWGTISRTKRFGGTYHFYTDDEKFAALWTHAEALPNTGCIAAVEANYSTNEQMPLSEIIHRIYRKRWLSRYWQSSGVQIVVDLNVARKAERINMLGVPRGWASFATRGYAAYPGEIVRQAAIARKIADGKSILFIVCGGGRKIEQLCKDNGFLFMPGFDIEQIRSEYSEAITANG